MKKRVFLSIDNLNIGGAQEQVKHLYEFLVSNNFDTKLLICYPNSYFTIEKKFKFLFLLYYNTKYFFKIFFNIIASNSNDKFFTYLSKSNFIFFLITFLYPCKGKIYFAYRNDKKLWNYKDLLILYFGKLKKLNFTTNNLVYNRYFRSKNLVTFYTPNLISNTFKLKKHIKADSYNFVSVCRCVPSKRIIEILDFVFHVSTWSNKNVYYNLYLRTDDKNYEIKLLEKIKIIQEKSNNLIINIYINKLREYDKSDILILFSDIESSPNVVLEAMSENTYPIIYNISAYSNIKQFLLKEHIINNFTIDQYKLIFNSLYKIYNYNFEYLLHKLKTDNDYYYNLLLND